MLSRARSLSFASLALACLSHAAAQTTINWSGLGANSNWTTPANWVGGAAPANDGTASILFPVVNANTATVDASQGVKGLKFDFTSPNTVGFTLSGAATSLTIGPDGITTTTSSLTPNNGNAFFSSGLNLVLGTSQTWTTSGTTNIVVSGTVSGSGTLNLTGGGYVALGGNNTYSGGTVINGGALGVEHNNALGTGALTVNGPITLFSVNAARTIANAINLNAPTFTLLPYGGDLHLTGAVTLGADVAMTTGGRKSYFDAAIGETGGARSLTVTGSGPVILSGNNTYSGGTQALNGAIFFRNAASVPATGTLSSSALGYMGAGFNTGIASGFIAKFAPGTTLGTIGFDTDPAAASPAIINDPIDLTGFNNLARLGSATRATLSSSATITPAASAGYRFGGGGGSLWVESRLTGSGVSVTADSAKGSELTAYLTYSFLTFGNDYTGPTSATRSAIVFGPSSAPTASTFTTGVGGYIGTQDLTLLPSAWIGNFAPATSTGVIGFDNPNLLGLPVSVGSFLIPIDLSRFTGTNTTLALGTTSAVDFAGTIILPAGQANYHFAGYKGGAVTVSSSLSGNRGVKLGDASGNYPDFDPNNTARISTVTLSGNNSHTGGTTLYSGKLIIGDASALGTGTFTVDNSASGSSPLVETTLTSSPTFSNPMTVAGAYSIGGANSFTWSGNLTNGYNGESTGTLTKYGASTITFSGENSGFSGGFLIANGTLTFASNTALGTGELDFTSSNIVTAAFTSSAPSLSKLQSDTSTARVNLAAGTTLSINQDATSTFRGQLQGSGAIVKNGTGTVRLEAASAYTGGTTINAGTIRAGATGALGTNTVTLNGTTSVLDVASGVTLANAVVFGSGGGRLMGNGAFSSSIALGANTTVSPGNSVGTLAFTNGLTWGPGGSYEMDVQHPTGSAGSGYDTVQVTGNLTFTATLGSPFTLFLRSLDASGNPGAIASFNPYSSYSWMIASSTNLVGFNPNNITINTTGFTTAINGGSFSLSTSSNNLYVNFTPVPEPSTWALLITGLGATAVASLRRRRSSKG